MSKQTFRYHTQNQLNTICCLCSQEVGFDVVTLKAICKVPCFVHVEVLDFFSVQQMQTIKKLKYSSEIQNFSQGIFQQEDVEKLLKKSFS